MTTPQPRTSAGRALLDNLYRDGGAEPPRTHSGWEYEDTIAAILAIEAEAAALDEELTAQRWHDFAHPHTDPLSEEACERLRYGVCGRMVDRYKARLRAERGTA